MLHPNNLWLSKIAPRVSKYSQPTAPTSLIWLFANHRWGPRSSARFWASCSLLRVQCFDQKYGSKMLKFLSDQRYRTFHSNDFHATCNILIDTCIYIYIYTHTHTYIYIYIRSIQIRSLHSRLLLLGFLCHASPAAPQLGDQQLSTSKYHDSQRQEQVESKKSFEKIYKSIWLKYFSIRMYTKILRKSSLNGTYDNQK